MPQVVFTENLKRHIACPASAVSAATVGEALERVFDANPRLKRYVLDDQGALRKHMLVFVDGAPARDRVRLSDPVDDYSEIFVMNGVSSHRGHEWGQFSHCNIEGLWARFLSA